LLLFAHDDHGERAYPPSGTVTVMGGPPLEPWTNTLRLDESSTMTRHCYADRFSIVRVETRGPLADAVYKSSSVPALLVSVFLQPVEARGYQLWVDGAIAPIGEVPALRANVIDLEATPAMWADRGVDYVHFHVRRAALEEAAADLGYDHVGSIRLSINEDDIVLAQIAKSVLPSLDTAAGPPPLALDHLELILGAHLAQRYGSTHQRRNGGGGGLAAWQRRRATELLRAKLDASVRLADLARACDLSVSHFSRAFKVSFGVTCHRWLTERRIERAKQLLALPNRPLADVASQCGFGDQASFTRTFHRVVGMTPGRWRRERAR
jgi:AraC family transcriptional regulator